MSNRSIPFSEITLTKAPAVYKTERGFKYPWAHEAWKVQQQVHWLPEEVPMHDDVKDWQLSLNEAEKHLLTQIFRFFTQGDVEVQNCYMKKYAGVFQPTEVQMMLSAFANMETIHVAAYAHLLETVGMPDIEFQAFLEYDAMRAKCEFLDRFDTDTPLNTAKTLAQFGAFTEGLSLFSSFAMLMNFPRHGKMKGMGQIVAWSIRDESLHANSIIRLFNTYVEEQGLRGRDLEETVAAMGRETVALEDRFIDLAFEMGGIAGLTAEEMKDFIRYMCDWRLWQMRMQPIYGHDFDAAVKPRTALSWFFEIMGAEHTNFFENRSTEYAKSATAGSWNGSGGVWDEFDQTMARRGVQTQETQDPRPLEATLEATLEEALEEAT